ncbi:hypothetical protein Tco_1572493, partial [Tanacetum coccineum]
LASVDEFIRSFQWFLELFLVLPKLHHRVTELPCSTQEIEANRSDQERDSGDDNTQFDSENGLDSGHETDENESCSEFNQEENKEEIKDDEEEKKGDDDVNVSLNEPVDTYKGFIQKEGTDAEMINV